jgi:hypothetical protein
VAGELHIGGAGVARGYLNQAELTAEKFIADPFSEDPQARLYKTGDLGRWLPTGEIEYLGRNDFQVKIRGFRIELGEIEAQLSAHDQVGEVAVIAREDVPGDKRLVAYVVARGKVSPEELRAHLKGRLPEYMVPAAFVKLERLPLTPNGKLDRKALPPPDEQSVQRREYEAPQGETEEALAGIWQELLRIERVGRHDNFFDLGGHSLLIVQMIERMRQQGLHADVRSVFTASSVAALAEVTGQARVLLEVPANAIPVGANRIEPQMLPLVQLSQEQIDAIVDTVPGGAANVQDIYPLAPLQQGILFHHLLNPQGDAYIMPALLRLPDEGRLQAFVKALQTVVQRHDILRTAVQWEGLKQPVQVVARQAQIPVQEHEAGSDEQALEVMKALADRQQLRMDLRKAPLLQAHVSRQPQGGRCYLLLLSHHIITDHVSLEIILGEVDALLKG